MGAWGVVSTIYGQGAQEEMPARARPFGQRDDDSGVKRKGKRERTVNSVLMVDGRSWRGVCVWT
jgi:hypothetical protein